MARFGLAVTSFLLFAGLSNACSVPVFRYALEQWPASRYELLVFHDQPLSADDRSAVKQFQLASGAANVTVRTVDLSQEIGDDLRTIWNRDVKNSDLPRAVLRYPESSPQMPSVWSGPLSTLKDQAVADSPARGAIFDKLTAGNAAVVVLLLSGDAAADDAARELLRKQLPLIAARIELPARTDDGPQVQSLIPLHLQFPLVEVARRPEEDLLVRILLGSEDGLDKVRGPIAFPVFGRGRALCSLHGPDLQKPDELKRSLEYLCRACSCQVKELNPGLDLLLSGDWDIIFATEKGPMPRVANIPPVPGIESRPIGLNEPGSAELRLPPRSGYSAVEAVEEKSRNRSPNWHRLGLFGAIGLVLVTGFWAFRGRRVGRPESP